MTQNSLLRKFAAWMLILSMMTATVTGCASSQGKTYESHSAQIENSELTDVQTAFDTFTQEIFIEEITKNTLNLHFTLEDPASSGISEYPLTLGEVNQESVTEESQHAEKLLIKLKQFDYDKLTFRQQLTYDIFKNTQELIMQAHAFPYYDEVLRPSIGIQAELPVLFAEYTFNTETDITDYLMLLGDVPRYFQQIIDYEQEKATAGLFMSDTCVDMIIDDCTSFISDDEENFLITTFKERINELEGLTQEQKDDYISQNQTRIAEDIVPSYEYLIDELTKLKGSGFNEGGLFNYPDGKNYYEYLLKLSTGSEHSVEELEKRTIEQINSDLSAMQELVTKNPELASNFADFTFTLTDPEEIIADLQTKMEGDFPQLDTKINLDIKYVSESMEDSLSPAFYLIPPIDNLNDNVIYINGGSTDVSSLYTTLAHEGFPGHLYQTVYSTSCDDTPLRQLCSNPGFSEGWATYVENLAYSYDTDQDAALLSFLQHNNSANLGLYALLDFYIHYEGYTLEEAAQWLQNFYDIPDEDSIKELYYYIVSQPCNYLKYYVGYLEILELKETAQETLGDKFILKDFHEFLLEIGDAPFYIIEDYMEAWMEQK